MTVSVVPTRSLSATPTRETGRPVGGGSTSRSLQLYFVPSTYARLADFAEANFKSVANRPPVTIKASRGGSGVATALPKNAKAGVLPDCDVQPDGSGPRHELGGWQFSTNP